MERKAVCACIIKKLKEHDDALKSGKADETILAEQKQIASYIRRELSKFCK